MKKFRVFLFVLLLVLSMSTASFAASSEPIFSYEFPCSMSGDSSSVYAGSTSDRFVFENGRQYYVVFDESIYETTMFFSERHNSYFMGDSYFFDTFVFSDECPFLMQLGRGSPQDVLLFVYSSAGCSDGEHTHSFSIYDENPAEVPVSDPAQSFMDSLNDGTIENAGNILEDSLNDLDGLTQSNGFVSFLSGGLSWVPTELWTVFTLGLVISLIRIVAAFLWR